MQKLEALKSAPTLRARARESKSSFPLTFVVPTVTSPEYLRFLRSLLYLAAEIV